MDDFKKMCRLKKDELVVFLTFLMSAYVAGFIVEFLILNNDETAQNYFSVVFVMVIFIYFSFESLVDGLGSTAKSFNLTISMGMTRKGFLKASVMIMIIKNVIVVVASYLLACIDMMIFKNIMPELSYDRMENFIRSSWIFVIFVGMLVWELLFMIAGIFVLKYEKKAYIAGYIAGMIVYFTFIRTISDYGDGKITLLGTLGLWLKNVSGAAAPLIWTGILLVFSVVLYMINYKLIMRQQVA